MGKNGDSGALYRKVGYNEERIKSDTRLTIKKALAAEVKQYDKNGAPKVIEYKDSKVQFIATRDDKDRGVWHRDISLRS